MSTARQNIIHPFERQLADDLFGFGDFLLLPREAMHVEPRAFFPQVERVQFVFGKQLQLVLVFRAFEDAFQRSRFITHWRKYASSLLSFSRFFQLTWFA